MTSRLRHALRPSLLAASGCALGAGPVLCSSSSATCAGNGAAVRAASSAAAPNGSMPEVTLYQYDVCPFCNKVKAFLDLHDVQYRVVEVNPLTKAEAKAVTDYRMVPFAFVEGEELHESTPIIREIARRLPAGADPSDGSTQEAQWTSWVDDKLVHILPPNIYRTPAEALQAFEYISDCSNFSPAQRVLAKYSGALIMYALTHLKLKKKYGIEDGREREALYAALSEWTAALAQKGSPYLGGDRPNLADISVFGVLRSLEGYPTFDDMLANTDIQAWYNRMAETVGKSARLEEPVGEQ